MKTETKHGLNEERTKIMLSSPILKGLTSFLSSLDAVSAVYDVDFKLTSTDSREFFQKLDISAVTSNPPVKEETAYPIEVNGEKMILTVTPIFKSKRIITAYIFVVRTNYQLYKQLCASSVPDYFTVMLDEMKKEISRCSEMNDVAQGTNGSKKIAALLEEQKHILDGLYSELNKTRYEVFSDAEVNSRLNCNISALLSSLCDNTAECLKDVKRKVTFDIDEKNYYSKIDFTLFTAAFSNILMYHMLCSPLKSTVNIKSSINSEKLLELTVKTRANGNKNKSAEEAARAKYFRDLAHKIICYDFSGECEVNNDGGSVVTVIKLPVAKKNRGSLLTSKNSAYLGSDYKPMNENLKSIIEAEAAALKKQRGSNKSDKE